MAKPTDLKQLAKTIAQRISDALQKEGGMGNGYETSADGEFDYSGENIQIDTVSVTLPANEDLTVRAHRAKIAMLGHQLTADIATMIPKGVIVRIKSRHLEHGCSQTIVTASHEQSARVWF